MQGYVYIDHTGAEKVYGFHFTKTEMRELYEEAKKVVKGESGGLEKLSANYLVHMFDYDIHKEEDKDVYNCD
ncbi:MAG: hypothetical protein J6Y02_09430 [Pseudobutyrivibrio sp.]|nr:hypothetical protein [Pseudobutyrivibrio sp.]